MKKVTLMVEYKAVEKYLGKEIRNAFRCFLNDSDCFYML